MSSDIGLGLCAFGTSVYGFGTPGVSNSTTAKLFIKPDGTRGNVAMIDPQTGDYVLDVNGIPVGDNSINQMMFLALRTTRNSSALLNFGIDISKIKTITPNIQLKFQLAVNDAVAHLIARNLVTITSVSVTNLLNKPTSIQVMVNWKDNSNGEVNAFKLI